MNDFVVKSPRFNQTFAIGTNTPKVDSYCPIDETQLVSVLEYDLSYYHCVACEGKYRWGDENLDSLREQATKYANEVKRQAEETSKKLAKLERIVKIAQDSGVLE